MSNFQMTWHDHTRRIAAARRRVLMATTPLPQPRDGNVLSAREKRARYDAHRRFVASLNELGGGDEAQEEAA